MFSYHCNINVFVQFNLFNAKHLNKIIIVWMYAYINVNITLIYTSTIIFMFDNFPWNWIFILYKLLIRTIHLICWCCYIKMKWNVISGVLFTHFLWGWLRWEWGGVVVNKWHFSWTTSCFVLAEYGVAASFYFKLEYIDLCAFDQ